MHKLNGCVFNINRTDKFLIKRNQNRFAAFSGRFYFIRTGNRSVRAFGQRNLQKVAAPAFHYIRNDSDPYRLFFRFSDPVAVIQQSAPF